jgi:hypothetical protein
LECDPRGIYRLASFAPATDADRERIVEGLASIEGDGGASRAMGARIARLKNRWFVVLDAHAPGGPVLLQPRWAMSYLRGPLTRVELRRAIAARKARQTAG